MANKEAMTLGSVFQATLTALVVVTLAVLFMVAVFTQDLLWFWPVFDEQPVSAVVDCYGEQIPVEAGTPEFASLVQTLNDSLYGLKRWDKLSLSYATLTEYRFGSASIVVEFSYDPAIEVHSYYRVFKNVDTFLVPLEGRHAAANPIFGMFRGKPGAGSLHPQSNAPLLDIVESSGICKSASGG